MLKQWENSALQQIMAMSRGSRIETVVDDEQKRIADVFFLGSARYS